MAIGTDRWRIGRLLSVVAGLMFTFCTQAGELTDSMHVPADAAISANATYGTHGMALFGGKDALFASHLPMFHAPHNYQVILQIEILDPAVQRSVRLELQRHAALWTINPESFALDALWHPRAPLQEFNAELFHGHFERGGTSRFKSIKIRVVRVVFHALLPAKPRVNSGYETYQALRVGTTNYLFKHITARPDFDHIVKFAGALATNTLQVVTSSDVASREATLQQALKAQFVRSIYLDDADLK